MLVSCDLLRFYINELDIEILDIIEVVEYKPSDVFSSFVDKMTAARTAGARDPSLKPIGDTWKLIMNSCYGSAILCKEKYTKLKYTDNQNEARQSVNDKRFQSMSCIDEDTGLYEIVSHHGRVNIDTPIQIAIHILMNAKLKLLEFYYCFLQKYLDWSMFSIVCCDTDSLMVAYAKKSIYETVRSECKQIVWRQIYGSCGDRHKDAFLVRLCCPECELIDNYTPGLLKTEADCSMVLCLSSKMYCCSTLEGKATKISAKGVNKYRLMNGQRNPVDIYRHVLETGNTLTGNNRGFRVVGGNIFTYSQDRASFSYNYFKREVLGPEGVYTRTLDITLRPHTQPNIYIIQLTHPLLSNTYIHPFS